MVILSHPVARSPEKRTGELHAAHDHQRPLPVIRNAAILHKPLHMVKQPCGAAHLQQGQAHKLLQSTWFERWFEYDKALHVVKQPCGAAHLQQGQAHKLL